MSILLDNHRNIELFKKLKQYYETSKYGNVSTGYLKSETDLRSNLLRFIILGKMRSRSKYFDLQQYYEHDALGIIIDKILKLVDSGFKLRYRDIKACVVNSKFVYEKGKSPDYQVDKLQVKIQKHYFHCKLRHYPYCPVCGNKPYKIDIEHMYEKSMIGHDMTSIARTFIGNKTTLFCRCGSVYHMEYGLLHRKYDSFMEEHIKYHPKIVELVKKRFAIRFAQRTDNIFNNSFHY